MDRKERDALKHDKFIEGSVNVLHHFEENPRPYLYGVGAVIAIFFVLWGGKTWIAGMEGRSAEKLGQGFAALEAPISTGEPAKPDDPYRPVYSSDTERARAAAARFAAAAGSGPSGALARYLQGVALLEAGDGAGAVTALEEAAGRLANDPTMGAVAKAALAAAHEVAGNPSKAAEVWKALSAENSGYARDLALAGLGRALEKSGKPAEAKAAYQQLVEQFPASPVVSNAKAALLRL